MRSPRFTDQHNLSGRTGHWLVGAVVLLAVLVLTGCSKLDWNKAPGMDPSTEFIFLSQCTQMEIGGPGMCGCVVQEMLKTLSLADFLAMGADQVPQTPEFLKQLHDTRQQCMKERGL